MTRSDPCPVGRVPRELSTIQESRAMARIAAAETRNAPTFIGRLVGLSEAGRLLSEPDLQSAFEDRLARADSLREEIHRLVRVLRLPIGTELGETDTLLFDDSSSLRSAGIAPR